MSLEKLKLSKRLTASVKELGFLSAKEIQLKTMSRILGGHDIVAIAPEGAGKTTTYILSVLISLKFEPAEAPKVLILAPDQERITEIVDQFYTLSKNKNLSIAGLRTGGSMEEEIDTLVDGIDIVVATPSRARAVYLKLGLNLNKLKTFIVDDAEEIIKQGMSNTVRELAQSAQKCQHLVFSTVEHDKLHHMIDVFMKAPTTIEAEEPLERKLDVYPQFIYHVPNFTTKINLLNVLLADQEIFDKVVLLVNTRHTAEKLAESLFQTQPYEVAILNPLFFETFGFDDIQGFKKRPDCRVLIIANEHTDEVDLNDIPFIIHFELPEHSEQYVKYIVRSTEEEVLAFTLATDIELPSVKRIEQHTGERMQEMELPDGVIIYDPNKKSIKNNQAQKDAENNRGAAFHTKKASNAKTYNIGAGKKARQEMKKKKG
ncbi:MAG: DEAD/DEAH box helicase [Sphingobacterium sp.]